MAPPATKKPTVQQQLDQMKQAQKDMQQQLDALKQQEEDDRKRIAREEKRTRALFLFNAFQFKVICKVKRWTISARNIGSAYVIAAKNHRDALAKVDKIKALEAQLLFSVLTLLTSGTFSLVWSAAGLNAVQSLLTPVAKDTTLTLLGEALSASGPPAVALPSAATAPPSTSDDALGNEPQVFQNNVENRISRWEADTADLFSRWNRYMLTMTDSAWDDWTEDKQQKAYDDWWAEASKWWGMKDTSQSPAEQQKQIAALAYDAERVMWATWMPRLKTAHEYWTRPTYVDEQPERRVGYDYEGIRQPIEDRFTPLNILKESGIDAIHWYHSAESEDTKLINWAANFLQKANGMWNS
jgi:hypothetical protein